MDVSVNEGKGSGVSEGSDTLVGDDVALSFGVALRVTTRTVAVLNGAMVAVLAGALAVISGTLILASQPTRSRDSNSTTIDKRPIAAMCRFVFTLALRICGESYLRRLAYRVRLMPVSGPIPIKGKHRKSSY